MILLRKLKNNKLFCFNNIIIPIFLLMMILSFDNKTIVNLNNSIYKYQLDLTYYYTGDGTGSGSATFSGITTDEFTVDEQGWYHYNYEGKDYLVIATALKDCYEANNHCGVDIEEHGIATNIPYYQLYDKLKLRIGPTVYDAIVLDACGACMWGDRDEEGEKIDIFVSGSDAVNPDIYESANITEGDPINDNHFTEYITTYDGEIKNGYLYNEQKFNAIKDFDQNTEADVIERRIDSAITRIFNKSANYSINNNYELIVNSGEALEWKQYDSNWGSIYIGTGGKTIKQIGCLATSVAIQIKNSGTALTTQNFNPGTFVQYLNNNNGFSGSLFRWDGAWKGLAPYFNFVEKRSLPTNKQDKIDTISDILKQGYYPVMCVKKDCGHWVAVVGVEEDNILIADPGSSATTVWPKYNAISNDSTLKVSIFKKLD